LYDSTTWLRRSHETCYFRNESYKEVEQETQRLVSELKVYEGFIENVPSIIFSLYAGPLADSRGRTLVMALPFIGNILSYAWLIVSVIWWDKISPSYLIISGVSGLTGGYMCMNIGLYSYIADTSSTLDRTYRMSVLSGIFSLGYIVGVQLGSRLDSYLLVFGLAAALGFLGVGYALFVLEESLNKDDKAAEKKKEQSALSKLFSSAQAVVKPRPGRTRFLILVSIFQFLTFMVCINTTEYDYLMTRLRYGWERQQFGNYLTVQRTCRLIGLLVVLPILSRALKVQDSIVVCIGLVVSTVAYSILAFSDSSWGGSWPVFLSAGLQLNSISTVGIRSILSKLVESQEVGKVFSVVGVGQAIIAFVSHSLMGLIYNRSLGVYPTLYLVPVIFLLFVSAVLSSANIRNPREYSPDLANLDNNSPLNQCKDTLNNTQLSSFTSPHKSL